MPLWVEATCHAPMPNLLIDIYNYVYLLFYEYKILFKTQKTNRYKQTNSTKDTHNTKHSKYLGLPLKYKEL